MSLTEQGDAWEWRRSRYILLTFPFGFFSCLAFWYVGLRARKLTWLFMGWVYFLLIYFPAYYLHAHQQYPGEYDVYAAVVFGCGWLLSIAHAFAIRKKYLLRLEARSIKKARRTGYMRAETQADFGLADTRVDEVLVRFAEDDVTVKLCRYLSGVLPLAPDFQYYYSMADALQRTAPGARNDGETLKRARQLAVNPASRRALKVARGLDMADSGLGVYTGFKNVYAHIKDRPGVRTFEADPQQAIDAVLKAVGIAYMIATLFAHKNTLSEKVQAFWDLPAGREMLLYYAAIEIAIPFTDNLLESGGTLMSRLVESRAAAVEERFQAFVENPSMEEVRGIMGLLSARIDQLLGEMITSLDHIRTRVQAFVPDVLNVADSATGALAIAIDLLPVYQFLSARLVTEVALARADARDDAHDIAESEIITPLPANTSASVTTSAPVAISASAGMGEKFLTYMLTGLALALAAYLGYPYVYPLPGNVLIQSDPAGAQIYLSGIETALTTPHYLRNYKPGEYRVTLRLEGYRTEEVYYTINAEGRLEQEPDTIRLRNLADLRRECDAQGDRWNEGEQECIRR